MGAVPSWVWFNSAMMLAAGVYLWWRLVLGTTRRGTLARSIGTGVALLVGIAGPVALIGQYALPISAQRVIGWPSWLGYAFVIFAGSLTLLTEPVRVVLWLRRRRAARTAAAPAAVIPVPEPAGGPSASADPVPDPAGAPPPPRDTHDLGDRSSEVDRRLFLNRVLAGGVLVIAAAITGVAARTAVAGPSWVRTATIRIRNLPPEAEGMRIALVSDLHLGSITSRDFCQQVVDLVNAQQPDMVCIAGDLTDGQADQLLDAVQPITQLRAPDGVFFVTGNHEFYFDPAGWLAALPTLGLRVLANEGVQVRGVLVAGVHDIQGERIGLGPDMDAALAGRGDGQPVVLMSHSPSLVSDAADRGVDLMVAGHTHGGQFIPGKWIVALTTPALSGWYEFGPTQVFVSNGAGFWGPIARLGADPDITMLTLQRA